MALAPSPPGANVTRILLVEDDPRTVALVTELLEGSGYGVESVRLGADAVRLVGAREFDLVVLDINLPDLDGLAVCEEVRAFSAVPILMLSARGGVDDRVDGLRRGADDYLPKPYDPRELLARIEAIARRVDPAPEPDRAVLRVGPLRLDPSTRQLSRSGRAVDLTAAEYDIVRVLMERPGRVVSRERLSRLSRGVEWGAFDRALDVHVSRIRKKLDDDPRSPRLIKTVRGVGYVLLEAPPC